MNKNTGVLYIFSGLPASGKTTLARKLAKHLSAMHLRIDTIEQGLRDLCGIQVEGEGYRLAYRMAADNLRLGLDVIADSCNLITLTRDEWEGVAKSVNAKFVNVEVLCSDEKQHQQRVNERKSDIATLTLPNWEKIREREQDFWDRERIQIDTAYQTPEESLQKLLGEI